MRDVSLDGLHVLVMEDEFLIALDVEQLCRDHGASNVAIVRSLDDFGPDSLDPFQAAIIDVMLDGRSTMDFAQQLLARSIPFVFATGYADSEDLFKGFDGVAVVGKPYSGNELMEALAGAIARRPRDSSGGV